MQLKSLKNLTRFDYGKTDFEGWRVCKAIKGTNFCKYVSDNRKHSKSKNPAAASLKVAKAELSKLVTMSKALNPSRLKNWAKRNGFAVRLAITS